MNIRFEKAWRKYAPYPVGSEYATAAARAARPRRTRAVRRCGIVPHTRRGAARNSLARLWAVHAADLGYILIYGLESHLVMITSYIMSVSQRTFGEFYILHIGTTTVCLPTH